MLNSFFHLEENGTTVRRELLAGLTTFLVMAYIVVVNPQILSQAGMPADGTFLKLDLHAALKLGLGELIFVFFFVDLFDNVGTLVGVCEQGGFLHNGRLPRRCRRR